MGIEIKDALTPVATLVAVWLGARFTLQNELRKKELEIKAAHLQSLAENCDVMLLNILNYAGYIAGVLDAQVMLRLETSSSPSPLPSQIYFGIDELNNWRSEIDESPKGLNNQRLMTCQHGLEFHRKKEWAIWKEIVTPLESEIYDFFMITTPGKENIDMKNGRRTAQQTTVFTGQLRERMKKIHKARNVIIPNMAADFHLLTQPKRRNIYQIKNSICQSLKDFFSYR